MKYISFMLFVFLYIVESVSQEKKIKFQISPQFGIDYNKTSWSISGDIFGKSPDYLSELIWQNFNFSQGLESSYTIDKYSLNMIISRSKTFKGDVSDTDYTADGRNGMNYNENFTSTNSTFLIFQLFPEYNLYKDRLFLNMGYNYISSHNMMNHSKNINSKYSWFLKGFKVGFKYNIKLSDKLNYSIKTDALFNKYYARADWILRNDLKHPISFDHNTKSNFGINSLNSINYVFNHKYSISMRNSILYVRGKKGIDKTYLQSGGILFTQLKDVKILNLESNFSFTASF
ncbi:hypothetical protein [Sphingobacterium faecium]|uniref:hypothetical protein n=1 Tax=Sphingobacterium faecium TaxID=34087 RepID=UPI003207F7EE